MALAGVGLSSSETALLLGLIVRRLGQVWRRAEQDTPESWLTYADRIGPECLPAALRDSAVGREALTMATAAPDRQNIGSKQAVVVLADALAAGFAWAPGQKPELDSLPAATAALSARAPGASGASGEPDGASGEALFWPLTSRAQSPQPVPENKLLKADPADPGNLYRALWHRVKAALQKLPADAAVLPAALVQVLREVDNVPVPLAPLPLPPPESSGAAESAPAAPAAPAEPAAPAAPRFAGMTDVVMTAWPLAASLWRAVSGQMNDSAAAWYATDAPWWQVVALRLEPAVEPATLDAVAGLYAAQGKALQQIRDAVASALGRESLTAATLGAAGAGDELWLLESAAGADAVRRAVAAAAPGLAEAGLRARVGTSPVTLHDASVAGRGLAAIAEQALESATDAAPPADPFVVRPRGKDVRPVAVPVEASPAPATPAPAAALAAAAASAKEPKESADATATPAIARPTLAAASPQTGDDAGHEDEHEEDDAADVATQAPTASARAAPAVARIVPASTRSGRNGLAGLDPAAARAPVDLTSALRRQAELAFSASAIARAAGVRLLAGPDEWWVAGPASAVPEAVVRLVEFRSAGWGHRPPSALWVSLVSGEQAAAVAARSAVGLARRAGFAGGSVAWFPRHSADLRACFPLADLPHVARMGMHVLNLSGLRISADGRHHIERLGRGHEWVAGRCRHAANVALPEGRTTEGAASESRKAGKRNGRWRSSLSYSLNRYLGRRRHWSRKKAPPSPVDVLVDSVSRNKWLGADRSTRLDATLYLDLAGRWVEALRPDAD